MPNNSIIFSLFDSKELAQNIGNLCGFESGVLTTRRFPDGESYLKLDSNVSGKDVYLVCGLENPDEKTMALIFFSNLIKEKEAKSLSLISPYLGYLRQDKIFNPGEALTSKFFAKLLSPYIDFLITIDPHLHRIKSLSEIYSIKTRVLHATDGLSNWVKLNIKKPLLIGPDEESRQWTEEVAKKSNSPFIILTKKRLGDKKVEITFPDISQYLDRTPVLIDDIISTGTTMIEASKALMEKGMAPSVCLAVHGIFAQNSFQKLKKSGVKKIVTCNTIKHPTNAIDIAPLISRALIKK